MRTMFAKKPLIAKPSMMPPRWLEGIIPPNAKVEFYCIPVIDPTIIKSPISIQKAMLGSKYSVTKGNGIIKTAPRKLVQPILRL
jgi:hypothetical protein